MDPIQVVLVTTPGCHFCEDAQKILAELGESFSLSIDLVPLSSDPGREFLVQYRVPFPPILVIDGSFFGFGRISRRKLTQRLTDLAALRAVS